ncbi:PTMA isoform 4 [Pongo abelii]|uniref:PTMA isoform 4 n=1 Tax=Pongo abelii TaxID=9601 RepID=A0A2J8TQ93_PONAB|nr:PTMA isoform 4 [Pongo abelii]
MNLCVLGTVPACRLAWPTDAGPDGLKGEEGSCGRGGKWKRRPC